MDWSFVKNGQNCIYVQADVLKVVPTSWQKLTLKKP